MICSNSPVFERLCVIGVGLIGSSILRVARDRNLAKTLVATDSNDAVCQRVSDLGLADEVTSNSVQSVLDADCIIICVPSGSFGAVAAGIADFLRPNAVVTDTGSVKGAVIKQVMPHLPAGISFIPAHPVAGTENSGPDAGFSELFQNRWCIFTPLPGTDEDALERLSKFWRGAGSAVEIMSPEHHDLVFAITSHLPHLIAFNVIQTSCAIEQQIKAEIIKFSAGGFRDFTRIAASDPIVWRDIFLNNKLALLEVLGRFSADLDALQHAIRMGEGETLVKLVTETRAVRLALNDVRITAAD